jgi:ribonuclease E
LVIDRTEAMVVIDVNTGKYTGSGGNLEQTVTRNNLEAAEEIVRQLRLRDVGGIIVIDFIDMVLESNRDLVLRRLTECLGRDRTKHQVAEVTSLGLVQMTRKRVGEGLLEAFSEPCSVCNGRGVIVHAEPVDKKPAGTNGSDEERPSRGKRSRKGKVGTSDSQADAEISAAELERRRAAASAIAAIAAATNHHDELVAAIDAEDAAQSIGGIDTPAEERAEALEALAAVSAAEEGRHAAEVAMELVTEGGRERRVGADQPTKTDQPTEADEPTKAEVPTEPDRPTGVDQSTEPELLKTAPRPRRRRAASRPAGPPTTAAESSAAAQG